MIEIPEAAVLVEQINKTLVGKVIHSVIANHSPHKFAGFAGDPADYEALLAGTVVEQAVTYGSMVEIQVEHARIMFHEGIILRYYEVNEKLPKKHQLLIEFEDASVITASVQMYGGICCFKAGEYDNKYYLISQEKPSPLSDQFDNRYFQRIIADDKLQKKSVKALLATEQRIPGLGNGVLQDILYNAKIHPKRKVETLTTTEKDLLFESIKRTLLEMMLHGGRDTEKDLFGNYGGYKTQVSKKTVGLPCEICGGKIVKKAYMGGSIYYCVGCQPE